MANESIDDLVSISEQGINVDTEKRIIIRKLAQYNDPDDYYHIYETSYTDEGNIILEIVPKNSHYGKRVEQWNEDEKWIF